MECLDVEARKDRRGAADRRREYGSPALASVRALLGPSWIIEGEDPERYEKVLAEVGAAAQPIDFIDWLLVKDIVDLTWENSTDSPPARKAYADSAAV